MSEEDIQVELDRRRPGQSKIVTQRKEADQAEILSGLLEGITLGTPIAVMVRNQDQRSESYKEMETAYRPSHADYTYDAKYGVRAVAGGGRSSARETIGRVAAGAIARKVMRTMCPGYECIAHVKSVREITADIQPAELQREVVESNIVRTGDPLAAERMIALIEKVRSEGNSVGGVVECVVRGVPKGEVNIWCAPVGSGEIWNYREDKSLAPKIRAAVTPKIRADNKPGEWNRFIITMRGDRITVSLNGQTVIDNAQLPGIPARGPIGLQHHGDPIQFANLYIRELN